MAKKSTRTTRGKIIDAAWQLFYRQGYDDTTVEEIIEDIDPEMDRFDQLMYLNRELFAMIENSISLELLARLYSSQLVTRGDKSLLDHNRTYYRLLRQIVRQGQQRGELRVYALCERALIYDWCLSGGDYSLMQYSRTMMPMFLQNFRTAGHGQP